MYTHEDLGTLQNQSLKLQGWIRQQTFSPELKKTLRRFSSWEVAELIFKVNQSTFRGKLAADPSLPAGEVEPDGRQRWFSLEEINELRRRLKINRKSLMPTRPAGKRDAHQKNQSEYHSHVEFLFLVTGRADRRGTSCSVSTVPAECGYCLPRP